MANNSRTHSSPTLTGSIPFNIPNLEQDGVIDATYNEDIRSNSNSSNPLGVAYMPNGFDTSNGVHTPNGITSLNRAHTPNGFHPSNAVRTPGRVQSTHSVHEFSGADSLTVVFAPNEMDISREVYYPLDIPAAIGVHGHDNGSTPISTNTGGVDYSSDETNMRNGVRNTGGDESSPRDDTQLSSTRTEHATITRDDNFRHSLATSFFCQAFSPTGNIEAPTICNVLISLENVLMLHTERFPNGHEYEVETAEVSVLLKFFVEGPGNWIGLFESSQPMLSQIWALAQTTHYLKYAIIACSAKVLGYLGGVVPRYATSARSQFGQSSCSDDENKDWSQKAAEYHHRAVVLLKQRLFEHETEVTNAEQGNLGSSVRGNVCAVSYEKVMATLLTLCFFESIDGRESECITYVNGSRSLFEAIGREATSFGSMSPTPRGLLPRKMTTMFFSVVLQDILSACTYEACHSRILADLCSHQ